MDRLESRQIVTTVVGIILWLAGLIVLIPLSGRFALRPLVQIVISNTPGQILTLAIELFGQWALVLLTGSIVLTVSLGILIIAVVWPRTHQPGNYSLLLVTLIATASLFHGAGVPLSPALILYPILALIPLTAYIFTGGVHWSNNSRRRFLKRIAGGVGAVTGLAIISQIFPRDSPTEMRSTSKDSRVLTSPSKSVQRGSPSSIGFNFEGMPARVTPIDEHYIVDKNNYPPVANNWSLDIRGEVENPLSLSLDDLRGHDDATSQIVTMECVSNPVGGRLISTAEWTGVPLIALLNQAQLSDDTVDIVTIGLDAYSEAIPVDQVQSPNIFLAYEMNGQPLPSEHGSPLRLLIPGRYGFRSTKWVSVIRAVTTEHDAFWEKRGWDEEAVVNTLSYIRAIYRTGNQVAIGGVAYAGLRGIKSVEISFDGGASWDQAELEAPLGELAWRRWRFISDDLSPSKTVEAIVRATDGHGNLQTQERTDPHPGGSTGWHKRRFNV